MLGGAHTCTRTCECGEGGFIACDTVPPQVEVNTLYDLKYEGSQRGVHAAAASQQPAPAGMGCTQPTASLPSSKCSAAAASSTHTLGLWPGSIIYIYIQRSQHAPTTLLPLEASPMLLLQGKRVWVLGHTGIRGAARSGRADGGMRPGRQLLTRRPGCACSRRRATQYTLPLAVAMLPRQGFAWVCCCACCAMLRYAALRCAPAQVAGAPVVRPVVPGPN